MIAGSRVFSNTIWLSLFGRCQWRGTPELKEELNVDRIYYRHLCIKKNLDIQVPNKNYPNL